MAGLFGANLLWRPSFTLGRGSWLRLGLQASMTQDSFTFQSWANSAAVKISRDTAIASPI